MEKGFIQIKVVLAPVVLMTSLLLAQESKRPDSTTVASSSFPVPPRATHTVRYLTRYDLQYSPIRDLSNLLALQNGIIRQDGALHVRGGRAGQIAYFIDGANATNVFFNNANFTFIPEAVQELQVHTGAYSAEYGGANSALVQTLLRTGGSKFEATVDYRTDDFAKPGDQFLGTSPFGYRSGVVTLSGPIPSLPRLRFFVAGQHYYIRNRGVIFLKPFRFDGLKTDAIDPRGAGIALPGAVFIERNYLPKNWERNNSLQGTLVYDGKAFAVRLSGSYTGASHPLGRGWPEALPNLFQRKTARDEEHLRWLNLKATHQINSSLSCEAGISHSSRTHRQFDPDFGDNWMAYTDSLTNAKLGYTGYPLRYQLPLSYSAIFGFKFLHENFPITTYSKDEQSNWGLSFAATSHFFNRWKLKVGGSAEIWTLRRYAVGDIPFALIHLYGQTGQFSRRFESEYQREVELSRLGRIDYYGYDIDYYGYDYEGRRVNDGNNAPHRPNFASFFVQNHFSYYNFAVDFGLRYERFALKVPRPANLTNPVYDLRLNFIDETTLIKTQPVSFWLPRLSFAFKLRRPTEFFAAIGKYVQTPALQNIYISKRVLSNHFSPFNRGAGGLIGFSAQPERSTHFEMGIRQALGTHALLTATYFNKSFDNLLRPGSVLGKPAINWPDGILLYTGLINRDETQVQGVELNVILPRTKRLAARVDYAFSNATGTEADPVILIYGYGYSSFPNPELYTLEYNQKHRGAVTLDYRFNKGEGGKIFEGLGLNVVMSFNSGHPYTQLTPRVTLGQSNPWEVAVLQLADPLARRSIEPPNASTTPWNYNVDLGLSKQIDFKAWNAEFYIEHRFSLKN